MLEGLVREAGRCGPGADGTDDPLKLKAEFEAAMDSDDSHFRRHVGG